MITIVDYGMGNLGSIANMLRRVGAKASISGEPAQIAAAEKLILPGVGAFDLGMRNLEARGLRELICRRAKEDKVPLLGICLGMQLLTRGSEEGELPGLGLVPADTVRFKVEDQGLKVPHMGWNTLTSWSSHPLWEALPEHPKFYFVHSYHARCDSPDDVLARTRYGYEFDSAIGRDNVMGVQFHPEKSHRYGMQVLKRFAEL